MTTPRQSNTERNIHRDAKLVQARAYLIEIEKRLAECSRDETFLKIELEENEAKRSKLQREKREWEAVYMELNDSSRNQ